MSNRNSETPEIKLVVFDLDGTLIDSADDIIRTTNRFLDSEGRPHLPADQIRNAIGEGLRGLLFNLYSDDFKNENELNPVLQKFFKIYEEELCKTTVLYPGIIETLVAQKHPIALLTNKGERHTHMSLKKLGIDKYPWIKIIGGDSLKTKKPSPEGLLSILELAQVTPKQTLMVGDGLPDVRVAKKIGCWSLACQYGYTRPHLLAAEKPDFFVEKPENLMSAISIVDDLVRNGYKEPL